jgi:hypothetical protein
MKGRSQSELKWNIPNTYADRFVNSTYGLLKIIIYIEFRNKLCNYIWITKIIN